MATEKQETPTVDIEILFAKATTDLSLVKGVSKYIRIGNQWDLKHSDVQNEVLVIRRAKPIQTKYGPAYLADCDHRGEQKTILFGGMVLVERTEELIPHLPVIAVICKPARAYQFRDATEQELTDYQKDYIS